MMRPFLIALAALVAAPALAQNAPIREVHVVNVVPSFTGEPTYQFDGQSQHELVKILAGGTLVVHALDSLRVMVLVEPDGLVPGTAGINAVLAEAGFASRALRTRPVRDPQQPEGTTRHRVTVLACTREGGDGECAEWRPAVPLAGTAGPFTLEVLDGATRSLGGGGVRTVDD